MYVPTTGTNWLRTPTKMPRERANGTFSKLRKIVVKVAESTARMSLE